MKIELIKLLLVCEEYESEEWNSRANNVKRYEEAIPMKKEYDRILQRQKRNMSATAYRQGDKGMHSRSSRTITIL